MPRGSAPGERRGGRKAGTPNKTTASTKAVLVKAFEKIGGAKALADWGKENRTEFYKLWGKMVPREITGADGQPLVPPGAIRITLVKPKSSDGDA